MATKKKINTKFKWLVVWYNGGYGDANVFKTDKELEEYLEECYPITTGPSIYRLDSVTKFKYEIPALSGILKEVK